MNNLALAPRDGKCIICREVTAVEHVALLCWDETGARLPAKPVMQYLRSIGMSGTDAAFLKRIGIHRRHIDRWVERGARILPVQSDDNVVRIPPRTGNQRWIDVNQSAIDLGNDALRDLAMRLDTGMLETNEVIALARLGVGAASTRGSMEQKGRALNGIDRLLQLAAGAKPK